VSFLFKWYAGLLIPLYLVRTFDMVRNIGERRRAFGGLLLGVSIVLAGHLWLLPLGGSVLDAMNPYAIHFERPPEVGSLPAAVLALVSPAYRVFDPNDLPKGDLAVGVGGVALEYPSIEWGCISGGVGTKIFPCDDGHRHWICVRCIFRRGVFCAV